MNLLRDRRVFAGPRVRSPLGALGNVAYMACGSIKYLFHKEKIRCERIKGETIDPSFVSKSRRLFEERWETILKLAIPAFPPR